MKAWLNAVELNVCLRQFKDRLRSVACLLDCGLKSTTTFKPVNGGFSLQWGQCGFYFLPVVLWSRFHLYTVIAPNQSGDCLQREWRDTESGGRDDTVDTVFHSSLLPYRQFLG